MTDGTTPSDAHDDAVFERAKRAGAALEPQRAAMAERRETLLRQLVDLEAARRGLRGNSESQAVIDTEIAAARVEVDRLTQSIATVDQEIAIHKREVASETLVRLRALWVEQRARYVGEAANWTTAISVAVNVGATIDAYTVAAGEPPAPVPNATVHGDDVTTMLLDACLAAGISAERIIALTHLREREAITQRARAQGATETGTLPGGGQHAPAR